MKFNRRQFVASLTAGLASSGAACTKGNAGTATASATTAPPPLKRADGSVDWTAVRELFPLAKDWTHLVPFLIVSHPRPVSEAIDRFRKKIDAEPGWLEDAAFADSEGKPFSKVKQAFAEYAGGSAQEICFTSNTTTGLAMAYHGLKIRSNQEILTTEHDHYVHHESIRYAAERAGFGVRYVGLYDKAASANGQEMVDRLARAIRPATRAVGITWVHSSTGVKIPVAAIADAVARANRGRAAADRCLLIVDGVHGFANQDVDVAKLGADFFATSGHKWLCAPRGTGFLWGRKDAWPEIRPTIPSFDPEEDQTWAAWMDRKPVPPTEASFVSPGGFLAYEHLLAVPAAVELHKTIGRDRIAARIRELNDNFREEAAKIPGLTLHTPRGPEVSAGLSCFEVAGLTADEVMHRLVAKKIRTSSSPYKTSYARVSAGMMTRPEEIETVLRELRAIVNKSAAA